MDRIIEQAEEISAWHLPLALRADLSARAIRRIGSFVGASSWNGWRRATICRDATRTHLNRELRARLAEAADAQADAAAAGRDRVAEAKKDGKLDGAFVDRRAQAGQREVVVMALAELANVTEQSVHKILTSRQRQAARGAGLACASVHAGGVQDPDHHDEAARPRPAAGARRHRLSADQGRDALASRLFRHSPC